MIDDKTTRYWQAYAAQDAFHRMLTRQDNLARIQDEVRRLRMWRERQEYEELQRQHEMAQAMDDDRRQNDG